jgi:hypothetical protein
MPLRDRGGEPPWKRPAWPEPLCRRRPAWFLALRGVCDQHRRFGAFLRACIRPGVANSAARQSRGRDRALLRTRHVLGPCSDSRCTSRRAAWAGPAECVSRGGENVRGHRIELGVGVPDVFECLHVRFGQLVHGLLLPLDGCPLVCSMSTQGRRYAGSSFLRFEAVIAARCALGGSRRRRGCGVRAAGWPRSRCRVWLRKRGRGPGMVGHQGRNCSAMPVTAPSRVVTQNRE